MHHSDSGRRSTRRRPDLNISTSADGPGRGPPVSLRARPADLPLRRDMRARSTPTPDDARDPPTFLDCSTPADVHDRENDYPQPPVPTRTKKRDSHEINLSPRGPRDSLVANMLLSLDEFSMGQSQSPQDDPQIYSNGADRSRIAAIQSRPSRGAAHTPSYSSDGEFGDDSLNRTSSQHTRRRSDSSSAQQPTPTRGNSMRETRNQRHSPSTPRHPHSRGGKGSKGSNSKSIDAGYSHDLGSQRRAHGIGGRSTSLDYGQNRQSPNTRQTLDTDLANNTFYDDDYSAAPTPTVPAGPRRLATVPSMPTLPPPEPSRPPSPERRRSFKSSKSVSLGRKDGKALYGRDVPPVPHLDLDSAPAPLVGYEKSKDTAPDAQGAAASQLARERPGFFRRMFGSSKGSVSEASPQPTTTSPAMISAAESNASKSRQNSQAGPPSREAEYVKPRVLQKKSSFFRRRKASTAGQDAPPLPIAPLVLLSDEHKDGLPGVLPLAEPSPITSLRRAMDPFLHSGPTTPNETPSPKTERFNFSPSPHDGETNGDRGRNVRGFSPGYEPDPAAAIRRVDTEPDYEMPPDRRYMETPTREPPLPPTMGRNGSFLADTSDSDVDASNRAAWQHRRPSDTRDQPLQNHSSPRHRAPSSQAVSSPVSHADADVSRRRTGPEPSPSQSSDDGVGDVTLRLPLEGARARGSPSVSPNVRQMSAASMHSEIPNSTEQSPEASSKRRGSKDIDEPDYVVGQPTQDDLQKAQAIYNGNEDFIQKEKAAGWMGEEGPVRQRTLLAYMNLHDFKNQSIVNSLRQVCSRLVFRAETQQVDRILVAFAKRWCDCNPNHGFKAADVIHTICYSIMLLNTDLHLADIDQKMTRSQFVKNTMTTIRESLDEAAPHAFDRPSILPGRSQSFGVDGDSNLSLDRDRKNSSRNSFRPPVRPDSVLDTSSTYSKGDDCGPLVKAPFDGPLRAWEGQVETVLKETYASIRDERLPLYGAESNQASNANLSVNGMLKRTPSVLSKAPSEGVSSTRGRMADNSRASLYRFSKSRSRHRGFGGNGFASSRTSFDDGNSLWSPTESSATWSRQSLGRTHTSMSMDSFGSARPRADYKQSIGFANALSQAIIREDNPLASPTLSDELKPVQLLEDESLELSGPPWVKEGIVTHKHHLDGVEKKAKDRNWGEVFAVIQKGQMSLFSFSPNKSFRGKNRSRTHGGTLPKGAVVGGGNWQENAINLGTFSLRQTLASALPPPGYSRQRPNVWALSLPTGAVHLFQVGTPEISKEFVSTANYWSARLSTHPLVGGISNIEYGWSDAIVNNALVNAINESSGSAPGTTVGSPKGGHSRQGSTTLPSRTSLHSRGSVRSGGSASEPPRPGSGGSGALSSLGMTHSHSHSHHHHHSHHGSAKLPGDRIHIAEWTQPAQSMRSGNLDEAAQLASLLEYVRGIEAELQAHNALRSSMLLAFTPRGGNATKAMANWQRKSEYLLREIVKFRTYVDALRGAEERRGDVYKERGVSAPVRAAPVPAGGDEKGGLDGNEEKAGMTTAAAAEEVEIAT